MAPIPVPILDLDGVFRWSETNNSNKEFCHTYGVFLREEITNNNTYWVLCDDTKQSLSIKLCKEREKVNYPHPKPGDVVRIHRLAINNVTKEPMVTQPRNIVFWPAFQFDPRPEYTANNPTLGEEDREKRRSLETFYCGLINQVKSLRERTGKIYNVAGRVDDIRRDTYQNILIEFTDGTGTGPATLRVFPKLKNFESDEHFKVAQSLVKGDYIMAANAKMDSRSDKLNLSALTLLGRSLRTVDKSSVLGIRIAQLLEAKQNVNSNGLSQTSDKSPTIPLRRSPRLNPQVQQSNVTNLIDATTNCPPTETKLDFTKLEDIRHQDDGFYKFYDLLGQVRGDICETRSYQNIVFQLYDGSKPSYKSYFVEEVKHPMENCVCILVYSKQRENDTDQHIEAAKKLVEGDLVYIKNVKVSWKNGKAKIEVNPNLEHGKSIRVIDKASSVGQTLLQEVSNPKTSELEEEFMEEEESSYSTPDDGDEQAIL